MLEVRLPPRQPAGARSARRSPPANGVDPNQPQTLARGARARRCSFGILDQWAQQRKGARVLLVIDVSGSMGDRGRRTAATTKLDLAKQAATAALDEFKDDDEVGLRVFSTDLGPTSRRDYLDLVPIGPIGRNRREIVARRSTTWCPRRARRCTRSPADVVRRCSTDFDPRRINAVVLLTDGRNEDAPATTTSRRAAHRLCGATARASRPPGAASSPSRYGGDADLATLRRIAEATNARRLRRERSDDHQRGLHRCGLAISDARPGRPQPAAGPSRRDHLTVRGAAGGGGCIGRDPRRDPVGRGGRGRCCDLGGPRRRCPSQAAARGEDRPPCAARSVARSRAFGAGRPGALRPGCAGDATRPGARPAGRCRAPGRRRRTRVLGDRQAGQRARTRRWAS